MIFCVRTCILHHCIIFRANPSMEEGKSSACFLESAYSFEIGPLNQLRGFPLTHEDLHLKISFLCCLPYNEFNMFG